MLYVMTIFACKLPIKGSGYHSLKVQNQRRSARLLDENATTVLHRDRELRRDEWRRREQKGKTQRENKQAKQGMRKDQGKYTHLKTRRLQKRSVEIKRSKKR